jgi:hypothetical protein
MADNSKNIVYGLLIMDRQYNDIDFIRKYFLDPPNRDDSTNNYDNVFLTSIIQASGDQGHIGLVEELNRSEGLEAVEHLLENDCRQDVDELFQHGIFTAPEKAIDVYKKIAENDQKLAYDLLTESAVPDKYLRTKMKAIYFENNGHKDVFENFKDDLDGYDY